MYNGINGVLLILAANALTIVKIYLGDMVKITKNDESTSWIVFSLNCFSRFKTCRASIEPIFDKIIRCRDKLHKINQLITSNNTDGMIE
jgi:hypothetical protein